MSWVVIVIIAAAILALVVNLRGSRSRSTKQIAQDPAIARIEKSLDSIEKAHQQMQETLREAQEVLERELAWLKTRWEHRRQEKKAGAACDPKWWWDKPTERQLAKLQDSAGLRPSGMDFGFSPLTKGAASDIIGLWFEPDDSDAEVLRYFKVDLEFKNQTRARYAVADLFRDQANRNAWDSRPASKLQKEVLEVLGIQVTKGLSVNDALRLRNDKVKALIASGHEHAVLEVEAYESIMETFCDKNECADLGIKKPSRKLLVGALESLKADGHTYAKMDQDVLVLDKLLELNPELERE